jgi:hypothetical protein
MYVFYPDLEYYWPGIVAVLVFTFFIGHVLFVVIEIGAVAILHCYVLDMDIQHQQQKPQMITPTFMVAYEQATIQAHQTYPIAHKYPEGYVPVTQQTGYQAVPQQ